MNKFAYDVKEYYKIPDRNLDVTSTSDFNGRI